MCELICKRFFSNYNAGVPIKMLLGNNNKTTKSNFLNNMYNIWFQVKISPKAVWLLGWLIQGLHRILKPPSFTGFVPRLAWLQAGMTMSSERKQTVYPLSLSLFFDNFI